MTGQGIRELRPSEVLGVPVVELCSNCVRLVHATNGEVDQSGDVRVGESNMCAENLPETPPTQLIGCLDFVTDLCAVHLLLLIHAPRSRRGVIAPHAHRSVSAYGKAC